jgi:hypothetical protein
MTLISMFEECTDLPTVSCPYDWTGIDGLGWNAQARGDLTPISWSFIPVNGWQSGNANEPSGGSWWQSLTISRVYSNSFSVGLVGFDYNLTLGSNYAGELHANPSGSLLRLAGTVVASDFVPADTMPAGPAQSYSHDYGGVTADEVWFFLIAGITSSSPADGDANIFSGEVHGTGTIDEC